MRECGLDDLPQCITLLVNLKEIVASDNQLKAVPVWLQELPIECLELNWNQISHFPPLNLPHLKRLYLYDNNLSGLPSVVRGYQLST